MIVNLSDLLPFSCKATGKCCIHNLVLLSSFDIFRIAIFLNSSAKELFVNKIFTYRINPISFWMEPILNSITNSTCPFLFRDDKRDEEKYLCEIYEIRPLVCRIYPLKYDKDKSLFMRYFPSENRCLECISTENNISLKNYLEESNIQELLKEFNSYLTLLDLILSKNYNLEKIKNNKFAQKKFFKMQSILYETYPEKNSSLEYLPFAELKERIENILNEE